MESRINCHSLRGECGLKYGYLGIIFYDGTSLSARRVWIEIPKIFLYLWYCVSLSARRVWIEIRQVSLVENWTNVTLCEESVD